MNIKWIGLILIILVVGLIVVELFVPKKINLADGTIKIFGNDSAPVDTTPEITK